MSNPVKSPGRFPPCSRPGCRGRATKAPDGQAWCRKHRPSDPADEPPPLTAAEQWPGLAPALQRRVEALQRDPKLLDPRSTTALHRAYTEVAMSDHETQVLRVARMLLVHDWTDDRPPTDDDITDDHMVEARRRVALENTRMAERHARLQMEGAKIDKIQVTITQRVLPALSALGQSVYRVIEQHIADEALRETILSAVQRELVRALNEVDRAAEEAAR